MKNNETVNRFRALLKNIPPAVAAEMDAAVRRAAEDLATTMRASAPVGATGNLRKSIRVEKGTRPLSYSVMAGGELTTHPVRKGSRSTYDYALAAEFGTSKESAEPFFWPSYRRDKPQIVSTIRAGAVTGMKRVVEVD